MSMNLTCKEVTLYQTPTRITWWCFGSGPIPSDLKKSDDSEKYLRKVFWKSQKGHKRQQKVVGGECSPFPGANARMVLWRYLVYILDNNIETRKSPKGKTYTYIDPTVYGHIKEILRQPSLTLNIQ